MRILIVSNGLFPIDEVIMFSRQFTHSLREPITLLKILSPWAEHPPYISNIIDNQIHHKFRDLCLHTKIRIGDTVDEVICEINENGYDLVMVGDRSNTLFHRIHRSTKATRIAELAPCPAVVVKGKTGPIKRILMCDSGNEKSRLLGRFTAQLADLFPGEEQVTILHVMSQISAGPGVRGEQLREDADKLIEKHTPEGELLEKGTHILEKSRVYPIPKIRHGLVVDEILAEARDGNYDLIVIGAYISEGWGRFLLDDLAHQILTRMDRSVLIVR